MIPLPMEDLPFVYAAIGLGLIALIWMASAIWKGRRSSKDRSRAVQCAACGTVFTPTGENELPRCPSCGHPNERIPVRYF